MSTYEITLEDGSVYEVETEGAETEATRPSLVDALKFGGSALAEGATNLLGMAADYNPITGMPGLFGRGITPYLTSARESIIGKPEDYVGGDAAKIGKAVIAGSLFPAGPVGQIANAALSGGVEAVANELPAVEVNGANMTPLLTGLAGSGLFGVAGLGAKGVASVGRGLRDRAIGLTARDYASAAAKMDLGTVGQGKERLLNALDEVEKATGPISWYTNLAKPTEKFLKATTEKAETVKAPHAQGVSKIVDEAGNILGQGQRADWGYIGDEISKLPASDQQRVLSRIGQFEQALEQQAAKKAGELTMKQAATAQRGGAKLQDLQAEKVAKNRILQNDLVETEADRIWRQALRRQIEKKTDALALAGQLSSKPGDVALKNRQFQALTELQSGLEKDLPVAQAANAFDTFRAGMSTTGTIGPQGLRLIGEKAGPVAGTLATLASLASYLKPPGRVLGQALKDFGTIAKDTTLPISLRLLAAAGLAGLREESETNEPSVDGLDQSGKTLQSSRDADKDEEEKQQRADNGKNNKPGSNKDAQSLFSGKNASLFNPTALSFFNPQLFAMNKPNTIENLEPLIVEVAAKESLSPAILRAMVAQESAGNPSAVSDAGAVGLMQLMPKTAKEVAAEIGLEDYDLTDPATNLTLGARYFKNLLARFGDPELALTAYHSGPTLVAELLAKAKGSNLADILSGLGPVGRQYAKNVLSKVAV